ncbi:unnamed protein product [Heterosigma akashiwo]
MGPGGAEATRQDLRFLLLRAMKEQHFNLAGWLQYRASGAIAKAAKEALETTAEEKHSPTHSDHHSNTTIILSGHNQQVL